MEAMSAISDNEASRYRASLLGPVSKFTGEESR